MMPVSGRSEHDRASRILRTLVFLHLGIVSAHAAAHVVVGVPLPGLAWSLFVLAVIWVAPLCVLPLLSARRTRAAALLFTLAMAGALIFGVAFHYFASGPDHVSQMPHGTAGSLFRWTAIALAAVEAAGVLAGLHAFHLARGLEASGRDTGGVRITAAPPA